MTRTRTLPRASLALVAVLLAACSGQAPVLIPTAPPTTSTAPATSSPAATASPSAATAPQATAPPALATTSPTQDLIDFYIDRVKADPKDGDAQLQLGLALLQRIRETADPSLYPSTQAALEAAHRLRPKDPLALVGLGGVLLGKHEFAAALKVGKAAAKLDPSSTGAGAVVVDALIELGRYPDAFAAVDRLVARSANLTSLARLSYARELQGDLPGALDAMQQAAASPGLAPENTAFALALVGHLQRQNADPALAREAYGQALALVPAHAPSLAGLGRLAVGSGDLDTAGGYFEKAVEILPTPEYVIAHGETLEASGDVAGARKQYDLARAEIAILKASGVVVDLDLALFEADHGDVATALELAEIAYAATPTVRAADALGWALHKSGRDDEAWTRAQEALRLGSRDPRFHYHAGAIALARGDTDAARRHLQAALDTDPGFSATDAAEARRLLASIAP